MEKQNFKKLTKEFFIVTEITNEEELRSIYPPAAKHFKSSINENLKLNFTNNQEACQFLVELIRYWLKQKKEYRMTLFCGQSIKKRNENNEIVIKPENEWEFHYKTPSTCGSCVRAQQILSKIFGSEHNFNRLCFVEHKSDREYKFKFSLLKYFAEHGEKKTKKFIKKLKEEEARKKAEEEKRKRALQRKKNAEKLKEMIKTKISGKAEKWVLDLMEEKMISIIKVVDPDVIICKTTRSEWGGGSGIGYFDQIYVYYYGQTNMKEWQWRDRWSADFDRYDLQINNIGEVEIKSEEKDVVKIELINEKYGNRYTEFTFEPQKRN